MQSCSESLVARRIRGSPGGPPRELKRGSCLLPFTPHLDEFGLMRLGGRADNAPDLTNAAKHPVLLHKKMVLARAIARAWHVRLRHVGTDTLLSETRRLLIRDESQIRTEYYDFFMLRLPPTDGSLGWSLRLEFKLLPFHAVFCCL